MISTHFDALHGLDNLRGGTATAAGPGGAGAADYGQHTIWNTAQVFLSTYEEEPEQQQDQGQLTKVSTQPQELCSPTRTRDNSADGIGCCYKTIRHYADNLIVRMMYRWLRCGSAAAPCCAQLKRHLYHTYVSRRLLSGMKWVNSLLLRPIMAAKSILPHISCQPYSTTIEQSRAVSIPPSPMVVVWRTSILATRKSCNHGSSPLASAARTACVNTTHWRQRAAVLRRMLSSMSRSDTLSPANWASRSRA
jgi:hypothetical protein